MARRLEKPFPKGTVIGTNKIISLRYEIGKRRYYLVECLNCKTQRTVGETYLRDKAIKSTTGCKSCSIKRQNFLNRYKNESNRIFKFNKFLTQKKE